jgi:hypothetical protein
MTTTTKETPLNRIDSELRRREWLRIYLPLLIGAVLFLTMVVASGVLGFREANLGGDPASVWGDTAAILIIFQVAAISVVPLVALVALCALVIWLMARLHPVLRQVQGITEQIDERVGRLADTLVTRVIRLHSPSARLGAIRQWLRR